MRLADFLIGVTIGNVYSRWVIYLPIVLLFLRAPKSLLFLAIRASLNLCALMLQPSAKRAVFSTIRHDR